MCEREGGGRSLRIYTNGMALFSQGVRSSSDMMFYCCLFFSILFGENASSHLKDIGHLTHGIPPCEGLNLANQKGRKLGVFGRNFVGNHSPSY